MKSYLKEFHQEDIENLLSEGDDLVHVSINVRLNHLRQHRPNLFSDILKDVWSECRKWDLALLDAQKQLLENNAFLDPGLQIKECCHVRFCDLPNDVFGMEKSFPTNDHVGSFVEVKGTVIRISQSKLIEFQKEYVCTKCKKSFVLRAEYATMFIFEVPRQCPNKEASCKGSLHPKNTQPKSDDCMDYQEIRIQEQLSERNIPASVIVTLESDLVDSCHPGENVIICGTVERRWRPLISDKRIEVNVVLRALSVKKDESMRDHMTKDITEQFSYIAEYWQNCVDRLGYFNARDSLIKSICPEIDGMYFVKLAIALAICSGGNKVSSGGTVTRNNSHVLLIGDPGLAKSKLLRAASCIAARSVNTIGMGCSSAGLTAAAIKEGGEWHLEAGALVLADGGICCIDEFNLMRENDKASILEAMEQQTLSMAKAGLVCKLSTRCSILAAMNPRRIVSSYSDDLQFEDIGITPPLFSRFDLAIVLRDERDIDVDEHIANHILNLNLQPDSNIEEEFWNSRNLKCHFMMVHDINCNICPIASAIISSYYQFCRNDPFRDPTRTSVRLLDSLNRLSLAHAKLMSRNKVTSVDAITIIKLMELTFGFGKLLKRSSILKQTLPIGPTDDEVRHILTHLNLVNLIQGVISEIKDMNKVYNSPGKNTSKCRAPEMSINDLEKEFGFGKNIKKLRRSDERRENDKREADDVLDDISIDMRFNDNATEQEINNKTGVSLESHNEGSGEKNANICDSIFERAHNSDIGENMLLNDSDDEAIILSMETVDVNFVDTRKNENSNNKIPVNNRRVSSFQEKLKHFIFKENDLPCSPENNFQLDNMLKQNEQVNIETNEATECDANQKNDNLDTRKSNTCGNKLSSSTSHGICAESQNSRNEKEIHELENFPSHCCGDDVDLMKFNIISNTDFDDDLDLDINLDQFKKKTNVNNEKSSICSNERSPEPSTSKSALMDDDNVKLKSNLDKNNWNDSTLTKKMREISSCVLACQDDDLSCLELDL